MRRLEAQAEERINRSCPLSFTFDGAEIAGFAGDTIASALLASGRHVLSRSFKYHRPRGELCGCGQCANSLVAVDGAPGVRACGEPAREGMRVEHQNAWPSLDFDALHAIDHLGGPLTQVGFYYKTFIRPRRLWPLYEKVLRNAAGLGRLPKHQDERLWRTEYRRRHCDVLVIGGGLAGLAAALAAAGRGADVVLCDEDIEPGGAMLVEGRRERARELAGAARAAGVEILSSAPALGYFDGLVPVWQGDTLHQVRAERQIVATGTVEQPLVFKDNDLPGVMLAGGARRLCALYALAPGERAVVATTADSGLEAALALALNGVQIAAVADLRPDAARRPAAMRLAELGVELLAGMTVVRAKGSRGVRSVLLARIDHRGTALAESIKEIGCDLLAVSAGTAPASSLLRQAGALASQLRAAGAVAGYGAADAAELSGAIAGAEAAAELGLGEASGERRELDELRTRLQAMPIASPAQAPASASDGMRSGRAFVDLDEDVTSKDVRHAFAEGYEPIELAKRYTTATMGPSQGRFSQLALVRLLADASSTPPQDVGLTTARPPWSTVPLGALAGRPFEPAKRSALHEAHRALGATVRWSGEWRRAYDYGDPAGEALAVHEAAGLVDVSTLGKLLVRGPQAGELLDRLYPNVMSDLVPGRVRSGVLLSGAGRITDDGTVCRLDEQSFYVTCTSSGAQRTEQWLSWWLTDWELDARITDVTQGVCAVNLAGPNARALLERLTELDVSKESFKYMDSKHAEVAGISCLLLRIGFVGESGYEIHCAGPHGRALWDAILEEGAELGVRPFGLEPQRILRLQKQHVLIGQDTDSESTPYGAGMGWVVKLDKPQNFIGRWALEHASEHPPPTRLVGFVVPSGEVPSEGAVVLDVAGGVPAGEVTSARRSPKLRQSIGLAWVPAALAAEDARIAISDEGTCIEAVVRTKPFHDPQGLLLRG